MLHKNGQSSSSAGIVYRQASLDDCSRVILEQQTSDLGTSGEHAAVSSSRPLEIKRKRNVRVVESDKDTHTETPAPLDCPRSLCVCPLRTKIPRPRNAFILYRQAQQTRIISQHPGTSNPKISKIIGEQWHNESQEVKDKWKLLAKDEKTRHRLQYPNYRYQPRRNQQHIRRLGTSPTASKCRQCGGSTILRSATPPGPVTLLRTTKAESLTTSSASGFEGKQSSTSPTKVQDRIMYLPAMHHSHQQGKLLDIVPRPPASSKYPYDRESSVFVLNPDMQQHRSHAEYRPADHHAIPARYGTASAVSGTSSGTLYSQEHLCRTAPLVSTSPITKAHGDSLPPFGDSGQYGPVPPALKPVLGYHQHRVTQGRAIQDRSLTLPPLQSTNLISPQVSTTSQSGPSPTVAILSKAQMRHVGLRSKIRVLSRVAQPAPLEQRGPLIAIEGDNPVAVCKLATWFAQILNRANEDFCVTLPSVPVPDLGDGNKAEMMARYHHFVGEWLMKSGEIVDDLVKDADLTHNHTKSHDIEIYDTCASQQATTGAGILSRTTHDNESGGQSESDEQSNSDVTRSFRPNPRRMDGMQSESEDDVSSPDRSTESKHNGEADAQSPSSSGSIVQVSSAEKSGDGIRATLVTPVSIIPNYSLYSCNAFAQRIPLGPTDPYHSNDHWEWMASQWRGIVGPDLTIYLYDEPQNEQSDSSGEVRVTMERLDGRSHIALFVVTRRENNYTKQFELDASSLRRLSFEVAEWIRTFVRKMEKTRVQH